MTTKMHLIVSAKTMYGEEIQGTVFAMKYNPKFTMLTIRLGKQMDFAWASADIGSTHKTGTPVIGMDCLDQSIVNGILFFYCDMGSRAVVISGGKHRLVDAKTILSVM